MRWLWLDRIEECTPGVTAVATKTFSGEEPFFADHFPGMPIVPGVLQVEMMAQMAGKCIALAQPGILPVLGSIKSAKFYHNINPKDLCYIKVEITKIGKSYALAEGCIEVNSQRVSTASILFGQVERSRLASEDFDKVTAEWKARQGEKNSGENR